MRNTTIRLSDDEKEQLEETKKMLFPHSHSEVAHGRVVGRLCELLADGERQATDGER